MVQSALPIAYTLIVCRAMIGLVFGISCFSKALNPAAFSAAIARFTILPSRWIIPATWLIILAEGVVALLMALGGPALVVGCALAIGLLTIFSLAMLRALARRMQVSCNCFGRTVRPLSLADVARNAILIVVSGVALLVAAVSPAALPVPAAGEVALLCMLGATAVAIVLHLHDLTQLYSSAFEHTS